MNKEIQKRYTESFKHQVVREYETGASESSLRQKYGIKGATTIKGWVSKYGRSGYRSETVYIQTVEDQVEVRAMKSRINELESVLAEMVLENRLLKTTLEVASEALDIDLKKSFGRRSSTR
jgi:transposase-like protein